MKQLFLEKLQQLKENITRLYLYLQSLDTKKKTIQSLILFLLSFFILSYIWISINSYINNTNLERQQKEEKQKKIEQEKRNALDQKEREIIDKELVKLYKFVWFNINKCNIHLNKTYKNPIIKERVGIFLTTFKKECYESLWKTLSLRENKIEFCNRIIDWTVKTDCKQQFYYIKWQDQSSVEFCTSVQDENYRSSCLDTILDKNFTYTYTWICDLYQNYWRKESCIQKKKVEVQNYNRNVFLQIKTYLKYNNLLKIEKK